MRLRLIHIDRNVHYIAFIFLYCLPVALLMAETINCQFPAMHNALCKVTKYSICSFAFSRNVKLAKVVKRRWLTPRRYSNLQIHYANSTQSPFHEQSIIIMVSQETSKWVWHSLERCFRKYLNTWIINERVFFMGRDSVREKLRGSRPPRLAQQNLT